MEQLPSGTTKLDNAVSGTSCAVMVRSPSAHSPSSQVAPGAQQTSPQLVPAHSSTQALNSPSVPWLHFVPPGQAHSSSGHNTVQSGISSSHSAPGRQHSRLGGLGGRPNGSRVPASPLNSVSVGPDGTGALGDRN